MEPQTAAAVSGLQDAQPLNASLDNTMAFTMGQSLKATALDTFVTNPAMALRDLYEYGSDRLDEGPKLTAAEANERYGHLGLTFDRPVTQRYAEILEEQKRQEITRDTIVAQGPQGVGATAARFAVGLGVSALDPINLASAFIPPLGAARLAAFAGVTGKVGMRAIAGGVGGFLGAAAVEPLVLMGAAARQDDYGLVDSMLNLTLGTALGSGIHVMGGYVGDNFLSKKAANTIDSTGSIRTPLPSNVGEAVEQMPAEQREAAIRTAVGQAANGQEVTVAPIMQAAANVPGRPMFGSVQTVYDAAGKGYDVQFDVVEAETLKKASGNLQPRDRTRIGSDDQINRLAIDMVPERLGESTDAATGAPIIGPDNVVESGNGRVAFITQAYTNGYASAGRYKDYLKSLGVDVSSYKQPILVRRRVSELSEDERRAFVVNAQAVGTMALSASERARADAGLVDRALEVAPLDSPNLRAGTSLKFVRAFLAQIPQSERAGLITGGGDLAQAGIARMRNGLLARAFDDADLLNSVLEDVDDNLRTLGNSLYEVSIKWADMRNSVRVGELSPYVDATDDLLNAVRFLRKAKDQDVTFREAVTQGEMGEIKGRDARTLETNQFLSLMLREDDKGNYRILPKDQIVERINRYVELARTTVPTDDMFGTPPAKASDLLEATRNEIIADANRQGFKPQIIDTPAGGIIRPRELAKAPDAPKLDVEAVRQQVYEDVLPPEQRPSAPEPSTQATDAPPAPKYATADNTPPERRRTPTMQDAVKLDSIQGDSMASKADLAEAEARAAEREKDIDADLVELEQMFKGMGEPTEAELNQLAEAETFIKNQPTIREAIMAAATCVIGK